MKTRFFLTSILLLLFLSIGFAWLTLKASSQPAAQIFHATIRHDCAPWDGAAFTINIDLQHGNSLTISIWQSPSSALPSAYTFPDSTRQIGNALLLDPTGQAESITGTVTFTHLDEEYPVEGNFKFVTASGAQIIGIFIAQWDYQVVLCG